MSINNNERRELTAAELDMVGGGVGGDGLPIESISFNYWEGSNPTAFAKCCSGQH